MDNDTLQQIAIKYSDVQQKLINTLFKETRFLERMPWIKSVHGLYNKFEEVTDVQGAGFREFNAPNVEMGIKSIVKREDVGIIAGDMSVSEETALLLCDGSTTDGGEAAERYFRKRTGIILNNAGQQTEKHFIYNVLYKKMAQYNKSADAGERTMFNAGGTGSANWSIFAIRQEAEGNCGFYSPIGKNEDELMSMEWYNDGALHKISSGENAGKAGYEAAWKAYIGYQLAMPKYLGGIFNIDPSADKMVTADMIDDLLDAIHANPSDTVLVMARGMQTKLGRLKFPAIRVGNEDRTLDSRIDEWQGIKIIGTETMLRGTEETTAMPWA